MLRRQHCQTAIIPASCLVKQIYLLADHRQIGPHYPKVVEPLLHTEISFKNPI